MSSLIFKAGRAAVNAATVASAALKVMKSVSGASQAVIGSVGKAASKFSASAADAAMVVKNTASVAGRKFGSAVTRAGRVARAGVDTAAAAGRQAGKVIDNVRGKLHYVERAASFRTAKAVKPIEKFLAKHPKAMRAAAQIPNVAGAAYGAGMAVQQYQGYLQSEENRKRDWQQMTVEVQREVQKNLLTNMERSLGNLMNLLKMHMANPTQLEVTAPEYSRYDFYRQRVWNYNDLMGIKKGAVALPTSQADWDKDKLDLEKQIKDLSDLIDNLRRQIGNSYD